MGASSSFRHFKALMRKNAINWKRTPLGSCLEIVLPVLLMVIMVYLRFKITARETVDFPLKVLKHPLYPISRPESLASMSLTEGEKTTLTMFAEVFDQQNDLGAFMEYANYQAVGKGRGKPNIGRRGRGGRRHLADDPIGDLASMGMGGADEKLPPPPPRVSGNALDSAQYISFMDPLGPYFFYPQHCYSNDEDMYNSTVIAYIKQGNQIEEDLIAQLKELFAMQANFGSIL